MLQPFVIPALNRLLRANRWALDALRVHAGKTIAFDSPPVSLRLAVTDSGELAAAPPEAVPTTSIRVPPAALLRFAARDAAAWTEADVSGDAELARSIDHLRRHLEWDFEEDLSRLFGDVAGHRMANGMRTLDRWGRAAALDLGRAFAEYAAHEAPLIASTEGLHEFAREVDELRAAVERLEERIAALRSGDAPR